MDGGLPLVFRDGQSISAIPAELRLFPDRIEFEKRAILRSRIRSIPYDQIAEVAMVDVGPHFKSLVIRTTGGGEMSFNGLTAEEASTARSFVLERLAGTSNT